MKTATFLSVAAFALLFPLSLLAADDCSEVDALNALYRVRSVMIMTGSSYDVSSEIDRSLDTLREPLREGGYRWVRYIRPTGEAPIVRREHTVSSEYGSSELETFEGSADHPFAVKVVVPRKRSLLKANADSYVGQLVIRYTRDGETRTVKKAIDQWMAPDTSKTFDLGVIADSADATVEVGTRAENRKLSVVELHFKQAVAQDDPANPNYETIQSLKRVRDRADATTLDYEIGRLERRLFPSLEPLPFTSLFSRIREAETLLKSEKEEDQAKGRKVLSEVVKQTHH